MILILTDLANDSHAEYVSKQLSNSGENVVIFNPATFPLSTTVTNELKEKKCQTKLSLKDQNIDLHKVKSIWYRRPGTFNISNFLKSAERNWIIGECNEFFNSLWSNLNNSLWVSKPENIKFASHKLIQLRIALELGFRIPSTIVTNDVKKAKSFLKNHQNSIIKPLSIPYINSENKAMYIYTHLITKEDKQYISSVRYGPTFLQEFIPKKMDVRVTVIGNLVFAVAIDSQIFEETKVDFRKISPYDLPHYPINLPFKIKNKCLKLVKKFGLQFGAIDLLLTKKNEYVFLEINPNGQWLWIEHITGVPLTKSLCNLLSKHKNLL